MKIALYQNLPPGGALRYMREVVARSSLEHDYTEFLPSYVERDWILRPLTNALSVASEERRLAAEIDAGDFDVAFVHGCRVMQAPGLLSMLKTPSVYMIQEPRRRTTEQGYHPGSKRRAGLAAAAWSIGRGSYDAILGRRDRKAVASASALACNSMFSAKNIARAYGREASVCYAGIDTDRFRPDETKTPLRSYYLSVGALDASKGHDLAIEAVGRLTNGAKLPLVIVGSRTSTETADALQRLARERCVGLQMRHSVTDEDLVVLYRGAAAVLCMAHLEPFGLTVQEAVSCGTPVVAVREGGYRETVADGRNGLTAEREPSAVADAITRLSSLGLARNPSALHATAARWDWDMTVKRLHEVLASVSGRK